MNSTNIVRIEAFKDKRRDPKLVGMSVVIFND